ncbi:MAG TPA: type II toxin-antitoxin system prevent-host-death family antitoxin [Stellaceae bacterium]|jgi:antitoxin YefM|nr:type II toxin-antitoxin system prevent-host-death family antitoxin [Stellaceae bacterium]
MAQFDEAPARFERASPPPSHISFTELRQNLKKHLDEVSASRAPLLVTRGKSEAVVMLALSEYESLQETLHLLRDPANAAHLLESLAQANAGDFIEANIDG